MPVHSNPECFSKSILNLASHHEVFVHSPNILGLFTVLILHDKYFILYHRQLVIYIYRKLPNHYCKSVKAGLHIPHIHLP